MKTFPLLLTALLAMLCLPVAAPARQPGGLQVTGRILGIDHTTRTITLKEDGEREPRHLVYPTRARFWDGASETSVNAFKAGMQVRITVHHPVFGPDFVTRVILIRPSQPHDQHRPS